MIGAMQSVLTVFLSLVCLHLSCGPDDYAHAMTMRSIVLMESVVGVSRRDGGGLDVRLQDSMLLDDPESARRVIKVAHDVARIYGIAPLFFSDRDQ